jgi:hypothetical protein
LRVQAAVPALLAGDAVTAAVRRQRSLALGNGKYRINSGGASPAG